MVGPFAQGIFLMGIIYWYSKGLMNLINDYYRTEFNRKLKTTPIDQRNFETKPQSYDLDDMEQLIKLESLKDAEYRKQLNDIEINHSNKTELIIRVGFQGGKQCYRLNRRLEFLNILFQFDDPDVHRKQVHYSFNYPICLLNENNT